MDEMRFSSFLSPFFLTTSVWVLLGFSGLEAQSAGRRLAIIDVDSDTLADEERAQAVNAFRKSIASRSIFSMISESDIETALLKKNPVRAEVEAFKKDQLRKQEIIRGQLEQAQKYYLASEFEDCVTLLQSAFQSANDALYDLNADLPKEILKLLSASHFFLGNEDQARAFAAAIFDLDPDYILDAQKFPPPFVELFSAVKAESRFSRSKLSIPTNQGDGVRAQFMGQKLEVEGGETLTLNLLLNHPIWGTKGLLLEKEGFAPIIFDIHQPPERLNFVTLEDRRLPTKGLLRPIGSSTPPIELKALLSSLRPQVMLLASVNRSAAGGFELQGQWLEEQSQRTSPVVVASHQDLNRGVEQIVSELFDYVSPLGYVLTEKFVTYDEPQEAVIKQPPYKTWWFWTLVGVAVVGAGVGGYFLLKPEDNLQVRVGAAQ